MNSTTETFKPVAWLVDDIPVAARMYQTELNADGRIFCAEVLVGWIAARAALRSSARKPDVLLLDIHMPEIDGITALEELRSSDANQKVLMFTVDRQYFRVRHLRKKSNNAGGCQRPRRKSSRSMARN